MSHCVAASPFRHLSGCTHVASMRWFPRSSTVGSGVKIFLIDQFPSSSSPALVAIFLYMQSCSRVTSRPHIAINIAHLTPYHHRIPRPLSYPNLFTTLATLHASTLDSRITSTKFRHAFAFLGTCIFTTRATPIPCTHLQVRRMMLPDIPAQPKDGGPQQRILRDGPSTLRVTSAHLRPGLSNSPRPRVHQYHLQHTDVTICCSLRH